MMDALRRYVDSLSGLTEVPRERAEKVMRDLAKRGELRVRDVQRAAQDLSDRSARNRQELVRLVQKEIKRQVQTLGLASREDVDRLSRRVKELERATKRTASKAGTTAKSAAKRATSPARRPKQP